MEIEPITYETAPNIALIKYWGKSDSVQNHAINASFSLTLDTEDLKTTTTIVPNFEEFPKLILNGKEK